MLIAALGAEHVTKQQLVVQRLRHAIIAGELPPGSWLRQVELSTIAGVSRTPIREALMQLASEGLVAMHPHKGVMAMPLSLDEFQDLYLVRDAVEPIAARLSAERMASDNVRRMECLLAELEMRVDDFRAFLAIEGQMRALQYGSCGRPNLSRVVESFRERAARYLHLFAAIDGHTRDKLRLDSAMVSAYRAHDGVTAERLTREALRMTVEALTPRLRRSSPGALQLPASGRVPSVSERA